MFYSIYKLVFVKKLKNDCDIKEFKIECEDLNGVNRKMEILVDSYEKENYNLITFKKI